VEVEQGLRMPEVNGQVSKMAAAVLRGSEICGDTEKMFYDYGIQCRKMERSQKELCEWIRKAYMETVSLEEIIADHGGPGKPQTMNKLQSRINLQLNHRAKYEPLFDKYMTVRPEHIDSGLDMDMDSMHERELAVLLNDQMRLYVEETIKCISIQLSNQKWVGRSVWQSETACRMIYVNTVITHIRYSMQPRKRKERVTLHYTLEELVRAKRTPVNAEVKMPKEMRKLIDGIPRFWQPLFYIVEGVLIRKFTVAKEDMEFHKDIELPPPPPSPPRPIMSSAVRPDPALCFGNLVLVGW
jgi:hypothetical protein